MLVHNRLPGLVLAYLTGFRRCTLAIGDLVRRKAQSMASYFTYTSQHWQRRAEEMRTLAKTIRGRDAKDTMLRIAQDYERLAMKAQEPGDRPDLRGRVA